jgi:hypothetical protein
MPQASTIFYVADLVIRRVLAEADESTNVQEALDRAYPFDDCYECRRIWQNALSRHVRR